MNTTPIRDPRQYLVGTFQIACALALVFSPTLTINIEFTALQLGVYLVAFTLASVLTVLGFERIFNELDRRKPES